MLAPALDGIRCVYHLARPNVKTWEEWAEYETETTRRIALACLTANVDRFIYTGTIDSYYAGVGAGTITEETPLDPHIGWRNYYARAKALSEQAHHGIAPRAWAASRYFPAGYRNRPREQPATLGNRHVVIRRCLPTLGPGADAFAISSGRRCRPGTGGRPGPRRRSRVESFNLVAESDLTAPGYLDALEQCMGVEFQKSPTPLWKFYVTDVAKWLVKRAIRHPDRRRPSYRDWESRTQRAFYDCSKARKVLGWNPASARDEIIGRGIQGVGLNFSAGAPASGTELVASTSA